VGDLDNVLQINAPNTVSSFMQRMGRTGRRENTTANTTFFIEKEQFLLQAIAIVELARSQWIENVKTNDQAWHILLHQIMALCLERGGISKDLPWEVLHKAYCFSSIDKTKFDRFVNFLLSNDFLHDDGGMLSIGLKAEKEFGRYNFMEIYSVFSTPSEFEVIGLSGDVIGSIEWGFLEKLLEEGSSFYLAGKPWAIERIEWKKRVVMVKKAPAGKVPKWGGINPSFLGYELCRKKRDVIVSDEVFSYLASDAGLYLEELRSDLKDLLGSSFAPIEKDDKGFIWWTYAGGYVNNSLRFALTIELNCEVQATNEYVKVLSESITAIDFQKLIQKMNSQSYWDNPEFIKSILKMMPDYRLSKFQPFLPRELQLKLVADTILDLDGVLQFLANCEIM